jgi:hypothetical protein
MSNTANLCLVAQALVLGVAGGMLHWNPQWLGPVMNNVGLAKDTIAVMKGTTVTSCCLSDVC